MAKKYLLAAAVLISLGTLYGCAPESAAVSETGKEKTEAGAESSEAGTEYPEEGAGDTEEGTGTSGLGNDSLGTEKAPLEAEAKSREPGAENVGGSGNGEKTEGQDSRESRVPDGTSFVSDSPDLALRELKAEGPMCTKLVIENASKTYGDTVDGDYPMIEFARPSEVASAAWWPEGKKIYIQFWDLAENGETEFYVDGAACRVELPDSEHAKKELDRAVDLGNGESCVLASLDQYEGAAVLIIAPGEATSALGPQTADSIRQRVRIKSGEDESPAFRISFSESGDEIKMLFLTGQGEEEPKLLLDGEALG